MSTGKKVVFRPDARQSRIEVLVKLKGDGAAESNI